MGKSNFNFIPSIFKGKSQEEKLKEIAKEICNTMVKTSLDNSRMSSNEIGFIFQELKKHLQVEMLKRKNNLHSQLEETNEVINKVLKVMNREIGYYWVKFHFGDFFEIAYWNGSSWEIHGSEDYTADINFETIDENPIKKYKSTEEKNNEKTLKKQTL